MLLKSISYYNFRPFKGNQKIDLRTDSDSAKKNVVVVLGDNTFGKSTFVLSFIWCLYGESRFSKADSILNIKVEDDMRIGSHETASVEIEFEDGNRNYTMTRTQRFYKTDNNTLQADKSVATLSYQTPDGETRKVGTSQSEIALAIKSILPVDLSSFFFFEGEKHNEIKKRDLKTAVETLIGLGALQEMREHIFGKNQDQPSPNSVLGEYLERLKDESSEKAKDEYSKYQQCEDRRAQIKQDMVEQKRNIQYFMEKKENITKLLQRAAPSEKIKSHLQSLARSKKEYETAIQDRSEEFLKLFGAESLPFFLYPFLERASAKLREMDVEDKGIKGIEASAIHALLERGECLCGTDLKEGSVAYKNVQKYIEYVPPRSIGIIVKELLDNIQGYAGKAEDFVERYQKTHAKIVEYKMKYNECESEEKEEIDNLRKIGTVDVSEAENAHEYDSQISSITEQLHENIAAEAALKSESERTLENYKALIEKGNKSARYKKYYKYAEAIYNWVQRDLAKKGTQIREKLEQSLQELFNKMYAGKREIHIDDRYNIVLTYKGKEADDSGGLRVIQYFAYVAALVKVAFDMMNEKKKEKEGESAEFGEQYPLVLDAAFSHADTTHTRNIAEELANSVPQLVFAVMHKDWVHAQKGLEGKVAHIYELEKIDETEVRIKQL